MKINDLSSALAAGNYTEAKRFFDEGSNISPYCLPEGILTNLSKNYSAFKQIQDVQFREFLEFRLLHFFSSTQLSYSPKDLAVLITAEYADILLPEELKQFYELGAFTIYQFITSDLDLNYYFQTYKAAFLNGFTFEDYLYRRVDNLRDSLKRCYSDRFSSEHINLLFDSIENFETLLVFAKPNTFKTIVINGLKLLYLSSLGEERLCALFSDEALSFYEFCKVSLPRLYKYPAKKIALLTSTNARELIHLCIARLDDLVLLETDQLEAILQDEFIPYFKERKATDTNKAIETGVPDPSKYSATYIFLSIATSLVQDKTGVTLDFDKLNNTAINRLKRLVSPRGLQLLKKNHDPLKLVECTDEEFDSLIPKAELAARHFYGKPPQETNPFLQMPAEIVGLVLSIPVERINRLKKAKTLVAELATVSLNRAKLLVSEAAAVAYEAGFEPLGIAKFSELVILRTMAQAVLGKKAFIFPAGFDALDKCDDIGKLKCLSRYSYLDLFLSAKISLSEFLKLPKSIIKLLGKSPESKLLLINGNLTPQDLLNIDEEVLAYILSNKNVEIFFKEGHCKAMQLNNVDPNCLPILFSQRALDALRTRHVTFDELVKLDIQRLTILLSIKAIITYNNNCKPPVAPLNMGLQDLWDFMSLIPDTLSTFTSFASHSQASSSTEIAGLTVYASCSATLQHQGQHK